MLALQARVTSKIRVYFNPASESAMRSIGVAGVSTVGTRIRSGVNVRDTAAKELSLRYARTKLRKVGNDTRNWTNTGALMSHLGITRIARNSVEVGWQDSNLQRRVAILQSKEQMFGYSPRDLQALRTAQVQTGVGKVEFRSVA